MYSITHWLDGCACPLCLLLFAMAVAVCMYCLCVWWVGGPRLCLLSTSQLAALWVGVYGKGTVQEGAVHFISRRTGACLGGVREQDCCACAHDRTQVAGVFVTAHIGCGVGAALAGGV